MAWIRSSIRNKLIVLLLLSIMIPLGISVAFSYQHTKRSVIEQTLQENINLLSEGSKNIGNYIKQIDQLGLSIYNNSNVMSLIERGVENEDNESLNKMKTALLTIFHASNTFKRVDLYISKSEQFFTISQTIWQVIPHRIDEQNIYGEVLKNPYRGYIAPLQNNADEITYKRAFIDVPKETILGYLTISVDKTAIEEMCRDLYVPDTSEFVLLNPEGQAVVDSANLVGEGNTATSLEWYQKVNQDGGKSGNWAWRDKGFQGILVYSRMTEDYAGWILVKRIPFDTLYHNAREIVKIDVLIGGLALMLAIGATLLVSFKITSPLQILVRNIRKIKKGSLNVDFEKLGSDEIGVVGDQFKSMVDTIRNLMIKEYNLEIQNKTQQLNTLQSQLNPHFLNNALQSIGALAYENGDYRVYQLIRTMSKIMRYSMDIEEEMVQISKEFDHVTAYLELQKHRFEERLTIDLQLDERCYHWQIPKMTLQPLVENYFKHAFDLQEEKGFLRIHTELVSDAVSRHLQITVEDNGCGLSEAEIRRIYNAVKQESGGADKQGKVGLVNLLRRIHLYYGESAEITLENRTEGGFRVRLLLPEHTVERNSSLFNDSGGEAD